MPAHASAKHKMRVIGTGALVFVHLWLAALSFLDLLSFTQPSRYAAIELAADSDWWGWIFLVSGVVLLHQLLIGAERHPVATSRACSASAAFLGVWAFFTLMWGLTTDFPVSLAVFGPTVFSVVGAQVLAVAWNHRK